jgi:hypothetical protein
MSLQDDSSALRKNLEAEIGEFATLNWPLLIT